MVSFRKYYVWKGKRKEREKRKKEVSWYETTLLVIHQACTCMFTFFQLHTRPAWSIQILVAGSEIFLSLVIKERNAWSRRHWQILPGWYNLAWCEKAACVSQWTIWLLIPFSPTLPNTVSEGTLSNPSPPATSLTALHSSSQHNWLRQTVTILRPSCAAKIIFPLFPCCYSEQLQLSVLHSCGLGYSAEPECYRHNQRQMWRRSLCHFSKLKKIQTLRLMKETRSPAWADGVQT